MKLEMNFSPNIKKNLCFTTNFIQVKQNKDTK